MSLHAQALKQALAARHPQNGQGPATNQKPDGRGHVTGLGLGMNDPLTKIESGIATAYKM